MSSRRQRYLSRGKDVACFLPALYTGATIAAPWIARGAVKVAPKVLPFLKHHVLPHAAVHGVVHGGSALMKRLFKRDRQGRFRGRAASMGIPAGTQLRRQAAYQRLLTTGSARKTPSAPRKPRQVVKPGSTQGYHDPAAAHERMAAAHREAAKTATHPGMIAHHEKMAQFHEGATDRMVQHAQNTGQVKASAADPVIRLGLKASQKMAPIVARAAKNLGCTVGRIVKDTSIKDAVVFTILVEGTRRSVMLARQAAALLHGTHPEDRKTPASMSSDPDDDTWSHGDWHKYHKSKAEQFRSLARQATDRDAAFAFGIGDWFANHAKRKSKALHDVADKYQSQADYHREMDEHEAQYSPIRHGVERVAHAGGIVNPNNWFPNMFQPHHEQAAHYQRLADYHKIQARKYDRDNMGRFASLSNGDVSMARGTLPQVAGAVGAALLILIPVAWLIEKGNKLHRKTMLEKAIKQFGWKIRQTDENGTKWAVEIPPDQGYADISAHTRDLKRFLRQNHIASSVEVEYLRDPPEATTKGASFSLSSRRQRYRMSLAAPPKAPKPAGTKPGMLERAQRRMQHEALVEHHTAKARHYSKMGDGELTDHHMDMADHHAAEANKLGSNYR